MGGILVMRQMVTTNTAHNKIKTTGAKPNISASSFSNQTHANPVI
jgi:hypothetical protein